MNNFLHGILPAAVTPFDANGKFNPKVFELLLARFYQANVHGVYLCGQTGEAFTQSVEQRKLVTEAAVACSPAGKAVVVHVGTANTADAVELTRHAARAGAHAVSSLPPPGAYSFAEVAAYYRTLAEASDLPLLVYYFPAASEAITTAEQIKELCAIPNVIGLKFTDYDLFKLSVVKDAGAIVFNGYDQVLVAGMLMGASGGIGTFYNLVPHLFMRVYELSRASRWDEARAVQRRINELIEFSLAYPVFPAVKAMLRWSGLDCGECLAPRRNLTEDESSTLRSRFLQFIEDE